MGRPLMRMISTITVLSFAIENENIARARIAPSHLILEEPSITASNTSDKVHHQYRSAEPVVAPPSLSNFLISISSSTRVAFLVTYIGEQAYTISIISSFSLIQLSLIPF